ncbi:MAG: hypothetical protein QOG68_2372 [Solirubrobacteraceae bacterium]|nr:hypothetical protein [Solirubrobacteraceae bacterium]
MARLRILAPFLIAAALLVPSAPASAKIQIGISEQNPNVFENTYFKALQMHYGRIVVPWNVAYRHDYWPKYLKAWLAGAKADNVEPHIAFGVQGLDAKFLGKGPTPAKYAKAVIAFRKKYPVVKVFSPWNEENHVFQPTFKSPKLAAQYYAAIKRVCKGCTVLGGDFLDGSNLKSWLARYKTQLIKYAHTLPRLWGLHNYQDANHHRSFKSSWTYKLTKLVKGTIWSTEAGGLVGFTTVKGKVAYKFNLTRQRKAQKYLFQLMANPKVRSRYKRVYIYDFYGTWSKKKRTNRWDSGLIGLDGKPRPAYNDLKKIIAANNRRAAAAR